MLSIWHKTTYQASWLWVSRLGASQGPPKPSLPPLLSHCPWFFQFLDRAGSGQLHSGRLLQNDYNCKCEGLPKTVKVQVSSFLGPSLRSVYTIIFLAFWHPLLSIQTYSGASKRLNRQNAVDMAQNDIPDIIAVSAEWDVGQGEQWRSSWVELRSEEIHSDVHSFNSCLSVVVRWMLKIPMNCDIHIYIKHTFFETEPFGSRLMLCLPIAGKYRHPLDHSRHQKGMYL